MTAVRRGMIRYLTMIGIAAGAVACAQEAGEPLADRAPDQADRSTSTAASVTTTESTTTTAAPPPTTLPTGAVGETVTAQGWSLLVHEVTDPVGPINSAAGTRAIAVDVEVTNVSAGEVAISSYDNFELSDGTFTTFGADMEDRPSVRGPLAVGQSRRGSVGFLVDLEVTTGLVLLFHPSFIGEPVAAVQLS